LPLFSNASSFDTPGLSRGKFLGGGAGRDNLRDDHFLSRPCALKKLHWCDRGVFIVLDIV
jgi:hypothetical protein